MPGAMPGGTAQWRVREWGELGEHDYLLYNAGATCIGLSCVVDQRNAPVMLMGPLGPATWSTEPGPTPAGTVTDMVFAGAACSGAFDTCEIFVMACLVRLVRLVRVVRVVRVVYAWYVWYTRGTRRTRRTRSTRGTRSTRDTQLVSSVERGGEVMG